MRSICHLNIYNVVRRHEMESGKIWHKSKTKVRLNPQAKARLQQIAQMNLPPLNTLTPTQARRRLKSLGALLAQPESVSNVERRSY